MMGRLRSTWNVPPASPAAPKRVWRDWALIVVLPLAALFEAAVRHDVPSQPWALIVTIAVVPTLLWRRTHPLLMLAIAFTATGVFRVVSGDDIQLFSSVYLLLLVYAIFRWGSGRALLLGLSISLVSSLVSVFFPIFVLADAIGGFAILLFTGTLGLLVRFRASSRMRELDRAKSYEREELARDLHDTVAHHVSAIAIQAQAGLATVGMNPGAATAALRVIEAEASRTLTEMRSMVRVLRRDESAELAPAPRVADLRQLASDDGVPVINIQFVGEIDSLPATVAAAVYRIAQESVTNARRHARNATRIDVHVAVDNARVRLRVQDDGAAGPAGAPGYGITGMTERAALLGGTCTAGQVPGGGWIVAADLARSGAVE